MSVHYLVTSQEWKLLEFLYKKQNNGDDVFSLMSDYQWNLEQENAALSLEKKGFLYAKEGSIYMDKTIYVLLDICHRCEEVIKIGDNRLFCHREIVVWLERDVRSLNGYKLTAYPGMKDWYDEKYDSFYPEPDQRQREQIRKWLDKE